MQLDFIRAWDPEDLGDDECVICEQPFERESVIVMGDEGRGTCPPCIEHLGNRNPEKFPTIDEYERAKLYFPEPIWADEEDRADLDPHWVFTNELSIIEREP